MTPHEQTRLRAWLARECQARGLPQQMAVDISKAATFEQAQAELRQALDALQLEGGQRKTWDVFITWHPVGNCGAMHIRSLVDDDVTVFDNAFVRASDGHVSFRAPPGVMFGVDALSAIVEAMQIAEG